METKQEEIPGRWSDLSERSEGVKANSRRLMTSQDVVSENRGCS